MMLFTVTLLLPRVSPCYRATPHIFPCIPCTKLNWFAPCLYFVQVLLTRFGMQRFASWNI